METADENQILDGTYELRELLGSGTMGTVWAAHDLQLDRPVAIKLAHASLDSPSLRNEARALAAINHPGIAAVYAFGRHRGRDYLVMERIYGISLAEHLARRHFGRQGFTVAEVVELLLGLSEGLAAVHRAGIAHRDVKPENILLAPGNRVVLVDLGIFFVEAAYTFPVPVAGTPLYQAPETISSTVEPGCWHLVDMYAVGIIGFEMLAGHPPFQSEDVVETWRLHLHAPAPDLQRLRPGLPPALTTIISEMLAKRPEDRPPRMEAIVWTLRALRNRLGTAELPDGFDVLVVDDEPHSLKLVEHCLHAVAPEAAVRTARDGEQALALVRQRPPHLLLVDLQMPRMNGLELCMTLRGTQLAEHCTIAAISARASEHDVRLLQQLGITRFLPKDADFAEGIASLVREVLHLTSSVTLP
jgi:eukaryotic-like serine/threonine-protein kinase